MTLPVLTSDDDVEAIVEYLKTRPDGATITETKTKLPRALLDPRKIEAYEIWGFISRAGDNIKLDSLGHELARTGPGNTFLIYRKLIHNLKPYHSAVEWMFQKDFDEITNIEISSHWQMHFKADLGTGDENMMKSMATCFLQVCQAAQFGTLTMGRSSGTNLFRIDKTSLGRFFTEGSLSVDRIDTGSVVERLTAAEEPLEVKPVEISVEPVSGVIPAEPSSEPRIFIATRKNMEMVEQIKTMLEVDKYNYEIAEGGDTQGIPVPKNVTSAMRKCNSAIIFATADEGEKLESGRFGMSPQVLLELGAASVLYGGRVVLVCDNRIEVPQVLGGFERIEFSGKELSWNEGVNLMKAVSKFRK